MNLRDVPPGTLGLIVVAAVVFAADLLMDGTLLEWGAKSHLIWAGEWHRLIAANFVHADLIHLAVDMYALYIFGRIVEQLTSLWRMLLVFLIGGAVGFSVSLLASPDAYSVGSSASIFALMGYTLYYRLRFMPKRWLPTDTAFAQIFGINLILGLTAPNIDQFAHLGGLVGGLLCGSLVPVASGPEYGPYTETRKERSGGLERGAALAGLFLLVWLGLFPVTFGEMVRPVAPAVAEAVDLRYGRYFAPFVAVDPAVLWIDPSRSDADWTFVGDVLWRSEGPPVAFGLYWRWTVGGDAATRATYRVHWERRAAPDLPWSEVSADAGVVTEPDQGRELIYRRGMILIDRPDDLYGDWRVWVAVDGKKQVEQTFTVRR